MLELKQFMYYLQSCYEERGALGNPASEQAAASHYHQGLLLQAALFFNWMVEEDWVDILPLYPIPKPVARVEQVQPLTQEQIEALRKAARKTPNLKRNGAIVLFLYVCFGKANKHRMVYFSRNTARALALYMRQAKREPHHQGCNRCQSGT